LFVIGKPVKRATGKVLPIEPYRPHAVSAALIFDASGVSQTPTEVAGL